MVILLGGVELSSSKDVVRQFTMDNGSKVVLQENRRTSVVANQMSLDELYGLGFDHCQKYPQEIQKMTKDDVNRVAKKYFNLEAYAIAIIRPPLDNRE